MRLLGSDLFLELELKYRTCAKTAVIPTAQFRRNRLRLRFKISERRVFSHDFDFGIKYERTKRYRVEKITREIIWYKHRQLTVRYDIYLLFLYNDVNVVKFLACKIFYFTLMRRHLLARAWNVFCHCFVSRRSSHSSVNFIGRKTWPFQPAIQTLFPFQLVSKFSIRLTIRGAAFWPLNAINQRQRKGKLE